MGCGRTGSFIASTLAEEGWSVYVIDIDPNAFGLLPAGMVHEGHILTVVGDGTLEVNLRRILAHDADVFVAVSGKSAGNVLAAQIAKQVFHLPTVICRVDDPISKQVYEQLDIVTISTEALVTETILRTARE